MKWYYIRMLSEVGKGGVKECMERYEMNVRWSLVDGRGADELFVSACMPISAIVVFRKVGEKNKNKENTQEEKYDVKYIVCQKKYISFER